MCYGGRTQTFIYILILMSQPPQISHKSSIRADMRRMLGAERRSVDLYPDQMRSSELQRGRGSEEA